jgi:hypothetical protein
MPKPVNKIDIAAREAWRILATHGVKSLLAEPTHNPKIKKNIGVGVLTAPLHLAPADLSGFNVCPMATKGCKRACLHTAGNPAYLAGKRRARIARTRAYFNAREAFMRALAGDIAKLERQAKRMRLKCGVRLNATSDIPWERVPVTIGNATYANLMQLFPRVQFYDYTKRPNRKALPSNYALTFSLSEDNDHAALEALANGMNVAAVFSTRRGQPLPSKFAPKGATLAVPVVDGDVHDYRPADPRGVIVGLRAKGRAIRDRTGFVRNALSTSLT